MVDDYEVGGLLGRGGMGEVHIARHRSGRIVAIKHVRKTLSLDPLLCERLNEEARILARIDHPNVVGVLDGGTNSEGKPFLVMARAFGTPLDAALAQSGPFSRDRITGIVSQLFEGLIAIHAAGVIHADLKSSNVLIDELDRVTIIDFGLARIQATTAVDDVFGGTPAYMAPEVLAGGNPSVEADIFAIGVIVYEMLTSSTPLPRDLPPMMLLARRQHETAQLPSLRSPERGITAALDRVLARALEREPTSRYTSVRDMADELAEALASWDPPFEEAPTLARIPIPTIANLAPTVPLQPGSDMKTALRPPEAIITRALNAASSQVASRAVGAAIEVLEHALQQLAPTDPNVEIVPDAWRVETVLAALYQSTGKIDRAKRMARVAYQHAQRSGSTFAQARASAVLQQVTTNQTRIARGSRAPNRRR